MEQARPVYRSRQLCSSVELQVAVPVAGGLRRATAGDRFDSARFLAACRPVSFGERLM